jgi:hypothetical protein
VKSYKRATPVDTYVGKIGSAFSVTIVTLRDVRIAVEIFLFSLGLLVYQRMLGIGI